MKKLIKFICNIFIYLRIKITKRLFKNKKDIKLDTKIRDNYR